MKIGQEIKFKKEFGIEATISGTKLTVKEGDKALVTKAGYKILTGEAKGKTLWFTQDEKAEGYDLENIAKLIHRRLKSVDAYEDFLEEHEVIEEIEDVLIDIF